MGAIVYKKNSNNKQDEFIKQSILGFEQNNLLLYM